MQTMKVAPLWHHLIGEEELKGLTDPREGWGLTAGGTPVPLKPELHPPSFSSFLEVIHAYGINLILYNFFV